MSLYLVILFKNNTYYIHYTIFRILLLLNFNICDIVIFKIKNDLNIDYCFYLSKYCTRLYFCYYLYLFIFIPEKIIQENIPNMLSNFYRMS